MIQISGDMFVYLLLALLALIVAFVWLVTVLRVRIDRLEYYAGLSEPLDIANMPGGHPLRLFLPPIRLAKELADRKGLNVAARFWWGVVLVGCWTALFLAALILVVGLGFALFDALFRAA